MKTYIYIYYTWYNPGMIKLSEDSNDSLSIKYALGNVSDVYFYERDFKRSVDYSNLVISIYRKTNDTIRPAGVFQNLDNTRMLLN